jgi:hypothetical protein
LRSGIPEAARLLDGAKLDVRGSDEDYEATDGRKFALIWNRLVGRERVLVGAVSAIAANLSEAARIRTSALRRGLRTLPDGGDGAFVRLARRWRQAASDGRLQPLLKRYEAAVKARDNTADRLEEVGDQDVLSEIEDRYPDSYFAH